MIDFFSMGGYGFYVWTAYGVTALVVVWEILSVRARVRRTLREARSSLPETPLTTRSSLDPAGTA